jgi:hypothetical protein
VDLGEANLEYADLRRAALVESDLSRANLRCADLRGASFYCASLLKADLSNAIMNKDTLFVRADLTDAVVAGTNLYPERLTGAAMPDGKPHRRSTDLVPFVGQPPNPLEDCPITPAEASRIRLWLPTLAKVRDLKWPPYCVCCGAPADRLTEWSGCFDACGGDQIGHAFVDLRLPYCTACLQHDARAADIPGPFLWEEMGLAGWAGFSLLWACVGLDTGSRILVLLSSLMLLGSLTNLVVKAIRHGQAVKDAKAALARWTGPACVPLQAHRPVFLGEITNLLGGGDRAYVLSFANGDYATRFAAMNALRVLS